MFTKSGILATDVRLMGNLTRRENKTGLDVLSITKMVANFTWVLIKTTYATVHVVLLTRKVFAKVHIS